MNANYASQTTFAHFSSQTGEPHRFAGLQPSDRQKREFKDNEKARQLQEAVTELQAERAETQRVRDKLEAIEAAQHKRKLRVLVHFVIFILFIPVLDLIRAVDALPLISQFVAGSQPARILFFFFSTGPPPLQFPRVNMSPVGVGVFPSSFCP